MKECVGKDAWIFEYKKVLLKYQQGVASGKSRVVVNIRYFETLQYLKEDEGFHLKEIKPDVYEMIEWQQ